MEFLTAKVLELNPHVIISPLLTKCFQTEDQLDDMLTLRRPQHKRANVLETFAISQQLRHYHQSTGTECTDYNSMCYFKPM